MRPVFKSVAERALLRLGLGALLRWRLHDSIAVLAYHNVVPDELAGCGDAGLHLPISRFVEQLDLLAESADILPLQVMCGRPLGESGRLRVAITFDDASRGAVRLALPELHRRNLPGTIFVAPALLGDQACWWDAYASGRKRFRDRAIEEFAGDQVLVTAFAEKERLAAAAVATDLRTASEDELCGAAADSNLSLASHGYTHRNLAVLSRDDLLAELTASISWLRARFANVLPMIAYPFGRWSEHVLSAAVGAGYSAGFLHTGGTARLGHSRPMLLPRLAIPAGLSYERFQLALGGLR